MGILIAVKDDVPPVASSTWTIAGKGDASGDITENSSTSLTIAARGTNDQDNIDYAYQTVSSGDIQLIATVPSSWTGTVENYTGFGVGLTEGTADGEYFAHCWIPNVGDVSSKYGVVGSRTSETGQSGQSLPRYVAITYDDTAKAIKFWESGDGSDWYQVGTTVSKTLTYNVLAYVFGTSHDPVTQVTATLTNCALTGTITLSEATPPDPVPRQLNWTMAFESGQIIAKSDGGTDSGSLRQSSIYSTINISGITKANPAVVTYSGSNPSNGEALLVQDVNGMTEINDLMIRVNSVNTTAKTFNAYVDHLIPGYDPDQKPLGTVKLDSSGYSTYTNSGTLSRFEQDDTKNGGLAPGSGKEIRVITGETIQGSTVSPRAGSYFLRSAIHYNYDHSIFAGNSGKNKARFNLNPPSNLDFDWDVERWMGFSVFFPANFEDEIATSNNVRDNMVFNIAAPGADTHMAINIRTPSGKSVAHFMVQYFVGPNSTSETGTGAVQTFVDIGAITKNAWNDFVIRHRWNPFSTSTNASQVSGNPKGVDKVFAGNKGILQVYAGVGGAIALTAINLVNEPVGLVPQDYTVDPLTYSFRQYKYGWHHHSTQVDGPVWIGFDEIREGAVVVDGTGYSDVHPDRSAQP